MEMSRQRLRPSLAETSFVTCPHCGGTGHVRSTESAAIHVLRDIEEEGAKRRAAEILVHVASPIAMYILNHKRARLAEIEQRYAMHVTFAGDDSLIPPQVRIERMRAQAAVEAPVTPDARPAPEPPMETVEEAEEAFEEVEEEGVETEGGAAEAAETGGARADSGEAGAETAEEAERRRRRRRRRRRTGRREDGAPAVAEPAHGAGAPVEGGAEQAGLAAADLEEHIEGVPEHGDAVPVAKRGEEPGEEGGDEAARGRRRGRRGGRRRRRDGPDGGLEPIAEPGAEQPELLPIYTGPTPANPFGGDAFDIFDVLEQAERAADRPTAAAMPSAPEQPPEPMPRHRVRADAAASGRADIRDSAGADIRASAGTGVGRSAGARAGAVARRHARAGARLRGRTGRGRSGADARRGTRGGDHGPGAGDHGTRTGGRSTDPSGPGERCDAGAVGQADPHRRRCGGAGGEEAGLVAPLTPVRPQMRAALMRRMYCRRSDGAAAGYQPALVRGHGARRQPMLPDGKPDCAAVTPVLSGRGRPARP